MCPGISTIVENLFRTFDEEPEGVDPPRWLTEYTMGAGVEVYQINITKEFCETFRWNWALMAEGIYLEFGAMLIGVARATNSDVVLNPSSNEIFEESHGTGAAKFFSSFPVGIFFAFSDEVAAMIRVSMSDKATMRRMTDKLISAEINYNVRRDAPPLGAKVRVQRLSATKRSFSSKSQFGRTTRTSFMVSDLATTVSQQAELGGQAGIHNIAETIYRVSAERNAKLWHNSDGTEKWEQQADRQHSGIDRFKSAVKNLVTKRHTTSEKTRTHTSAAVVPDNLGGQSDGSPCTESSGKPLVINRSSSARTGPGKSSSKVASGDSTSSEAFQMQSIVQLLEFKKSLRKVVTEGSVHNCEPQEILPGTKIHLRNHVVVFGCTTNILSFIRELRRPLMGHSYHPIVIVASREPQSWTEIKKTCVDVYLVIGAITTPNVFNRLNIAAAYSLVLLATRDNLMTVEEEKLETEPLYAYLKLPTRIPEHVFFTVEITCISNIHILNSTFMSMRVDDPSFSAKDKYESTFMSQLCGGDDEGARASQKYYETGISGTAETEKGKGKGSGNSHQSDDDSAISTKSEKMQNMKIADVTRQESVLSQFNWSVQDTHQGLPIFASGRAFVPDSFDSLLSQVREPRPTHWDLTD